jgi:hypothetical protein
LRLQLKKARRSNQGRPSWITSEGYFDFEKFPIDSVLRQAIDTDGQRFRTGCRVLGSMAAAGRVEAGVFLVGLLRYYGADLDRLGEVVEQLRFFAHESSAGALLAELRRVKSSNTTRRYLDRVLRSLTYFPATLVEDRLRELAADPAFSPKMRAKLRVAIGELR